MSNKPGELLQSFRKPVAVLILLISYLALSLVHQSVPALVIVLCGIILGTSDTFLGAIESIRRKEFGVDYIAILAILTALLTHEYLVGIVIAFMSTSGATLEEYAATQAKSSLTKLSDRIPHQVLREVNGKTQIISIADIEVNQIILVRKGEVIPLDGLLLSKIGVVDESSLTGEAYPADKIEGDEMRSGTINLSDSIRIKVTKAEKNSSYNKIVELVKNAQEEKAPLVRLADQYSIWFTIVTFIIATLAFLRVHSLESILAVLVVATPCPLILATPIALIGGMSKSAKERVIIKKLAALEALARVKAIIFDKTGTITLGKPTVTDFQVFDKNYSKDELLSIASSIERHSLHPLAKAVVTYVTSQKITPGHAHTVTEVVGKGITGTVEKKTFSLSKMEDAESSDMRIGLYQKGKLLAVFSFEDAIKTDSKEILQKLKNMGITLSIFTGDKKEVAEKLITHLGLDVKLKAECKPEDKQAGIEELKSQGIVTAMVGDGINDAPALALADVGMVFSNEEQTAASEAADIVFLGGDFSTVLTTVLNALRTITIAKQSILWGIGLSIICMIAAAFGFIPPLWGAVIQELIDVAVILNALRASR